MVRLSDGSGICRGSDRGGGEFGDSPWVSPRFTAVKSELSELTLKDTKARRCVKIKCVTCELSDSRRVLQALKKKHKDADVPSIRKTTELNISNMMR